MCLKKVSSVVSLLILISVVLLDVIFFNLTLPSTMFNRIQVSIDFIKNETPNSLKSNFIMNEESVEDGCKLILLWNEYQKLGMSIYENMFQKITTGNCPISTCKFTTDRELLNQSSAVLFHLPNLHWENYSLPEYRDPAVPWILLTYEGVTSVIDRSTNWGTLPMSWWITRNLFNRTMSFRKDSDIIVRHGYVRKRNVPISSDELEEIYSPVPSPDFKHYNFNFYQTVKNQSVSPIAWFVSHCSTRSGREMYIEYLQNYIGVDIFGRCGTYQCGGVKNMVENYTLDQDPCFTMVNSRYKFYISFENSICKDYITEKTYNALKLNTIPIVLGGVNYTKELPPGSFINAGEFSSPVALASYLYSLLQDDAAFNKYFEWRKHYEVFSFTSVPDPCELCSKLNSGELAEYKVYSHFYDWFVVRSGCIFTSRWSVFQTAWELAGARTEVTTNITEAAERESQAVWLTLKKAEPSRYFSSVNKTHGRK